MPRDRGTDRPWKDEEAELVKKLWPKTSATEIGKMLKRSRNSVLGKIYRLGLANPTKNFYDSWRPKSAPVSVSSIPLREPSPPRKFSWQ